MNENCTPMQNVARKKAKMQFKYDAKCSRKIMQCVVNSEYKSWSKINANCNQGCMKTEYQCKM